ncbi:aminoglycoside phosphotransferase family protein [Lederbergia graminis]|uniref:Aminoglycoside phosphotransferase family protein n=1 Tax=Lederbergia graminis TaxID=735518 RepID=A0ABW0LEJ2_9BACI
MVIFNVKLVESLIREQFPQWANLEIKPVKNGGHDNRTFHLGENMSVRLPSAEWYVPQVEKEHTWLPYLSRHLSLPISIPLAKGKPNKDYPYPWSIYKWLDGETITHENIVDKIQFAKDLAGFLVELQSIDATDGPFAGEHNFHRGGDLAVYDEQSKNAIENNNEILNADLLREIWELSLQSKWNIKPVWLHGDVAPGNLLVKDGKLCAVIDFGVLGVGDPACDAAMAWTFFDDISRKVFKNALKMDEETWNRARGWALWKALITFDGNKDTNKIKADEAMHVIDTVIAEYKGSK